MTTAQQILAWVGNGDSIDPQTRAIRRAPKKDVTK